MIKSKMILEKMWYRTEAKSCKTKMSLHEKHSIRNSAEYYFYKSNVLNVTTANKKITKTIEINTINFKICCKFLSWACCRIVLV